MPKHRVLITGAAGFTGSHAVKYFAYKGYEVVAAVRELTPSLSTFYTAGVNYVSCDLADAAAVLKMMYHVQADYVLHLAGHNSVAESWLTPLLFIETNLMAALHVLEAVRASGTARVLLVSSMLKFDLTYPQKPNHPYGLSKSLGEAAALCWGKLYNLDIVIAEPANLIGPGPSTGICALFAKYLVQWERGEQPPPFQLSSAEERRDFLDVRDAVVAYELLMQQGQSGQTYPVCSGQMRSLEEVTEAMKALVAISPPVHIKGKGAAADSSSSEASWSDIAAERLLGLGWSPAIPWKQSLTDILQYYRQGG
ncbi:UDP-2-acetamido-2,6-dideoxy-hexulose 4-reductase [Paenibacillus sp. CAA11]|uniref:NAD-dependent epimerase/dehydratase family protein n=1 Tax=Paenibacillus sp. CAA11 TaxID=1532905 RepID=UPI000D353489|nr:NAD-dependent epimerase/dehydratase family protein [Paenibacillus sp. CAA11]AWB45808.1 UDP-2-acetamido-2,6-dideoxy-hexulose 4-reductase [Paenibacillus sp. CAA11]